jgi:hypothetical protein
MKLQQGTCWGTHWEQQKKINPSKEKTKKAKPLECMLTHLIGY